MRAPLLLALAALVALAAPARAQPAGTLYLDTNVAGDVQTDRGGFGATAAYYYRGLVGLELDLEYHHHFFNDDDLVGLVPDDLDLNTSATLAMANVIVPFRIPGTRIWRPFATAGLGAIRSVFDVVNADGYDTDQTNVTFDAGVGIMHSLTRLVGLRAEVRYFHAFVDESARRGGYFKDYDLWRVSFGVTFGFPQP